MPHPFLLLIKGSPWHARREAKKRQIKIAHLARRTARDETILIGEAEETVLAYWYGEHKQAPFPKGTLLIYSPREDLSPVPEMGKEAA